MASWLPKIHIPLRCTPVIHETERQWALFTVFYSGHILFPPSSTSSPSLYVEDSTSSPTTKAKYDFYLGSPPLVPDCLPYRSIKPCPSSILTVLSVTCSLSILLAQPWASCGPRAWLIVFQWICVGWMSECVLSTEVGLCVSLSQRHMHMMFSLLSLFRFFFVVALLLQQLWLTKEQIKFGGNLLITHRESWKLRRWWEMRQLWGVGMLMTGTAHPRESRPVATAMIRKSLHLKSLSLWKSCMCQGRSTQLAQSAPWSTGKVHFTKEDSIREEEWIKGDEIEKQKKTHVHSTHTLMNCPKSVHDFTKGVQCPLAPRYFSDKVRFCQEPAFPGGVSS